MNARSDRPVVVIGMARSGIAAAEFLVRHGAAVVATDRKAEAELAPEALALRALGVRLELGPHRTETFASASLVVVSPGVPWELPQLEAARQAGVPVIAEIELAFRHLQGRVAAVTGTKGKTTTTAALGAMLGAAGLDARIGGNIGTPLVGLVEGATPDTVFAVEVSSFQLEGIVRFHPQLAIWLNLSPDHLDRHPSLPAYVEAKARVFENQTAEDWAVVNADDAIVLQAARRAPSRKLLVRMTGEPLTTAEGAFFAAGAARLRLAGSEETLFRRDEVVLPGAHLAGDLLVAAAAARLLGAPAQAIASAVRDFRGVEHVLEQVATIDGVAYYNDSKATNVEAARRSLEAFVAPVVVIMGGRYKGGDFTQLAPALAGHGRAVLAIGEAQERIAAELGKTLPVERCDSLRAALERARDLARPGDVVLLAPACSSFDMFVDYAERGRIFKQEVHRLQRAAAGAASGPAGGLDG
jgi:UDP-N-acetylmuramoylalanine--D-glutamate ligase